MKLLLAIAALVASIALLLFSVAYAVHIGIEYQKYQDRKRPVVIH